MHFSNPSHSRFKRISAKKDNVTLNKKESPSISTALTTA